MSMLQTAGVAVFITDDTAYPHRYDWGVQYAAGPGSYTLSFAEGTQANDATHFAQHEN